MWSFVSVLFTYHSVYKVDETSQVALWLGIHLSSRRCGFRIPELERSPVEGNGQYSCLGNPMERGFRWATVCGVTKELDMT